MPFESPSLQAAECQYAQACKELIPIARVNAAAVISNIEAFDHRDEEEAVFAPQAVAFGYLQLLHLHRINLLLSIAGELAAAEVLVD